MHTFRNLSMVFLVVVSACDRSGGAEDDPGASPDGGASVDATPGDQPDGGGLPPNTSTLALKTATYLGGSGSQERIQGVHVASDGSIIVVGTTDSSDFPTTPGAFQENKPMASGSGLAATDGFVAKLSPDASSIVWATYFGGSGRDSAYAARTDSQGNIYVVGSTNSDNFPTSNGAYDRTLGGTAGGSNLADAFVARFTPTGNFVAGTYLGGDDGGEENPRGSIVIDEADNLVYVSGLTLASDFPTTTGALQTTHAGRQDAFVSALSSDLTTLVHSTLIGGAGNDIGVGGVELRADGTVYVAGGTTSASFSLDGGDQATGLQSGQPSDPFSQGDAFLVRLSPTLDQLLTFTSIGGASGDTNSHNHGLAINAQGDAVMLINASSSGLATADGFAQSPQGGNDCLVAVVNEMGNVRYASYIGTPGEDECAGIHVDANGNIAISGGMAEAGLAVTADAAHANFIGGRQDSFITVFTPNLSSLVYSSYLGGSDDGGNGGGNDNPSQPWLAPDKGRSVWTAGTQVFVAGVSDASNLATSTSSLQQNNGGANDGFLYRFNYE